MLDLRHTDQLWQPLQRLRTAQGNRVGEEPRAVSLPNGRLAQTLCPEAQRGAILRTLRTEGWGRQQSTDSRSHPAAE
jgi:hypothetical protein